MHSLSADVRHFLLTPSPRPARHSELLRFRGSVSERLIFGSLGSGGGEGGGVTVEGYLLEDIPCFIYVMTQVIVRSGSRYRGAL